MAMLPIEFDNLHQLFVISLNMIEIGVDEVNRIVDLMCDACNKLT